MRSEQGHVFSDLRQFTHQLRRDRDLVEISAPVDANQEAAEIHRRVIAAGGPAAVFMMFAGAGVLGGVVALGMLETRNRRLEEIAR